MSRKIKYDGARVSRREHGPLIAFPTDFEIAWQRKKRTHASRHSFGPNSVRVGGLRDNYSPDMSMSFLPMYTVPVNVHGTSKCTRLYLHNPSSREGELMKNETSRCSYCPLNK
jgi:hypothetical protein